MEDTKIDYNNFDRLDLLAKKDKVDMVEKCYKSFKWRLVKSVEDQKYEDTINLTFIREHKIENKDNLQFMQIEMEETLNKISRKEQTKYSKTTILGLTSFLVILGLISCGLALIINNLTNINFICGGAFLVFVGLILITPCVLWTIKIKNLEENLFAQKINELNNKLYNICNWANLGGNNGK